MASTNISSLSAASALDATEIYPASQSSASKGVTGAQIQTMVRRAGSASAGSWPIFGSSASLLTSEVAGAEEYDGTVEYFGLDNSSRAVGMAEYFVCQAATHTLGSNTNVQAAFDQPSASAALTLPTGLYFFDCLLSLSSMSSGVGGNAAFDLKGGGNATLGDILYYASGIDGNTATVASQTGSTTTASQSVASIVSAVANATMQVSIRGMFRVTGGGTIVPSLKLVTAASAVVAVGSYFRCHCVGSSTATTCGNWS